MERFFCGTEVVSGEGALSALERWKGRRLLLVTEPFQEGQAAARQVTDAVEFRERAHFPVGEGAGTAALVASGARRLKEFDPDVVAAWGNGDILSTAGAMVFFGKKDCPLVLLPTVPGAGEALSGWVTVTHGNLRHTLVDGPCQPAMVLLDPSLYKRCERGILAEAGFSLLSDALESFTARGSGTIASMLARDAFCGTWAALPAASLGNAGAVQRLHMASVTVGMAQPRSGLGLCYAMAGALGSRYRVGMGKLKAILLPEVIGCNAHRVGSRYAELARAAGMGGTTEAAAIRNLRAAVVRLRRELGLPECLAQAGIPPSAVWSDAGALVAGILGDPVLEGNPVAVDDFMIRRILEAATGRR